MLRVLIVDDEPLARENLRILLETQRDIEIVGECGNAVEAIGAVHKLRPDVLFLDIQMPRISGLEMVGMLDPEHRPYIVFLTAFDEYAVKAFEEHAFDYLLKPIEAARLEKTLARLRQERNLQDVSLLDDAQQTLKYIPCTGHSRIWLLQMEDCLLYTSDAADDLLCVDICGRRTIQKKNTNKRKASAFKKKQKNSGFTGQIIKQS